MRIKSHDFHDFFVISFAVNVVVVDVGVVVCVAQEKDLNITQKIIIRPEDTVRVTDIHLKMIQHTICESNLRCILIRQFCLEDFFKFR